MLTGYGTRGPDAPKTAFDYSAFWSRSGIMSLIGEPDGPPMPCRPGQGDHATALNLLSATLAALRLRDLTDEGQQVEVTLQRTGAWTIGADVSAALIHGQQPQRINRVVPGNPLFNSYETADGRWLMLVMPTSDRYWAPACRALGREEWIDDLRYASLELRAEHTADLTAQLRDIIASETLETWGSQAGRGSADLGAGGGGARSDRRPADGRNERLDDLVRRERRIPHAEHAVEIAGADVGPRGPAPATGEHTLEVLQELGLSEEELAQLAADGVLG